LALIDTVVSLLETTNPEDVRSEDVLAQSGISSGSLDYHCDNFPDLIDQAIMSRYAADIDVGIEILEQAVENAADFTSPVAGIRAATRRTFDRNRASQRFQRSQVMARAAANQRFRDALKPHQERLNESWADLFRSLQAKGLLDPAVDPVAGSLFVQAFSMGFVVNDVSDYPVDDEAVVALIMQVMEKTFFIDDCPA